jgi:hypothetical protein
MAGLNRLGMHMHMGACEGIRGDTAFCGETTKQTKTGEGMGTRQIFYTFGADNISAESRAPECTKWTIFPEEPCGTLLSIYLICSMEK